MAAGNSSTGSGGSVGIVATQLAVAQGVHVISAVGEHDDTLARELGARPVRYGPGLAAGVRALGPVDAVFDAADTGVLADAVHLAGGARRVITLSDPTCMNWVGGRYWDRTSDLLGVNEALSR